MEINIHRLSRWFFICGQSPTILATRKRVFYGLTLASGLLLATRKRVVVFFHCHLVVDLILFQLVLYVFFYLLFILSYSIHI